MNLTRLQAQLEIDEGVVLEIYLDHLGYPTFGIGHLITEQDPEYGLEIGAPVSKERVDEAFAKDIQRTILACERLYGQEEFYDFPEEVQEILVNMCFNLGPTGLSKFRKMNTHLIHHRWAEAAVEGRDSRWYRQVTNRAERLMSRLEAQDGGKRL